MTFWHIDNSNRCGCVIWTSGKARAKISQYCGVCNFHHALISSRYRSIWFFWSMYRFILSFHWAYFIHLSIAKSVVWTIGIETLFLYFRYFPSILFLFSDKEGSLWKHERSCWSKDTVVSLERCGCFSKKSGRIFTKIRVNMQNGLVCVIIMQNIYFIFPGRVK